MSITECFDRSLNELEAKFMRLLVIDRQSEEFERLYREVDAALDVLAKAHDVDVTKAS